MSFIDTEYSKFLEFFQKDDQKISGRVKVIEDSEDEKSPSKPIPIPKPKINQNAKHYTSPNNSPEELPLPARLAPRRVQPTPGKKPIVNPAKSDPELDKWIAEGKRPTPGHMAPTPITTPISIFSPKKW